MLISIVFLLHAQITLNSHFTDLYNIETINPKYWWLLTCSMGLPFYNSDTVHGIEWSPLYECEKNPAFTFNIKFLLLV